MDGKRIISDEEWSTMHNTEKRKELGMWYKPHVAVKNDGINDEKYFLTLVNHHGDKFEVALDTKEDVVKRLSESHASFVDLIKGKKIRVELTQDFERYIDPNCPIIIGD